MELINNFLFTDSITIDLSKIISIRKSDMLLNKIICYTDANSEIIIDNVNYEEFVNLLKKRELTLQNFLKQREINDIKNKLKL